MKYFVVLTCCHICAQVQEMARNLVKNDPSDPSVGEKGAKELLKMIEDVCPMLFAMPGSF